ncbi:MAG: glycine cleavage system protein GcvH [Phycisphaerae bacterium]|nr:glycine cleavage system protein GcvH [Phycisphaerae bacterium]NUQ47645.1 glycine cleavage system protein GcvH [Phycisphaerae bacterium]
MSAPSDRKYLKTHEWHKLENGLVTIGVTQFAADELTDITYVDLPKIGAKVAAGKAFGVIESVKATSDLMCGIDGEVAEINKALSDHPELVNSDPFNAGWMIRVRPASPAQLDGLLSADAYAKQLAH